MYRWSQLFIPTLREAPADAEVASHKLLVRAGYIRQLGAGIYSYLFLGQRSFNKIIAIVREEMDKIGQEFLLPALHPRELWEASGRWAVMGDNLFRLKDRKGADLCLGMTEEEVMTDIARKELRSYKQLPQVWYQIAPKFRDEPRPRSGLLRVREFLMKDSYSFDLTVEDARLSYNKMFVSYLRTFNRMGLKSIPMAAESGPIGGDMSHEFIILADTGESEVFCHRDLVKLEPPGADLDYEGDLSPIIRAWTSKYAATSEKHDAARFASEVLENHRVTARGIEVGHIFFFGTKYSEPMGCKVQGPDGGLVTVQMGSYGIGVSRLVGAIIEASHDDAGIIWPAAVAPFDVGLINVKSGDADTDKVSDDLYAKLQAAGLSVLYDDRDDRPGAKFVAIDLIGLPWQLIVGPKGIKAGEVELKERATGARHSLSFDAALHRLAISAAEPGREAA